MWLDGLNLETFGTLLVALLAVWLFLEVIKE